MRHPLPVLNQPGHQPDMVDRIEIPIPCEVAWDDMVGDARVRHCGQCRQNVYNVASLSRPEALRLLESSGGRVCIRIFRRPDGTVITADCRERLRQARKRGVLVFMAVLALVLWAQVSAQIVGLMGHRRLLGSEGRDRTNHGERELKGGVAIAGTPMPLPPPPTPSIPTMGEPAPVPVAGKPRVKPTMGRPPRRLIESKGELRGKVKID